MSATITFSSDFSSFEQALDRAQIKLRAFGLEPSKVEKALSRIGESFSGQKIFGEAAIAARGIEAIGGASKLTAGEQTRVNALVTEAIAKYAALGKTAPPELLAIAKATEKVGTETTKVKSPMGEVLGLVSKLGPAIGISFSVGSIIGFAKSIGTFAGQMVDLQAQTRISTDRLQAFNYVGAGAGLTIEDIAGSADQLAKRIGDGDKSAVGALTQLNIKVDEFRRLSLDDAMLLIDDRLAGVANQFDQANIKADLFGRSGMKLGRIFDGNLRQVIKAAEDSGAVIDKELIKRADDFDDAWSQAWIRFKAGAVTAVGAVIDTVQKLDTALGQAKTKAEEFEDVAARIRKSQGVPDLPGAPGLPKLPALGFVQNPATQAEIVAITKQSEALAANLKKQEEFKASMLEMAKATKAFLSEANNADQLKLMTRDFEAMQQSISKATYNVIALATAGAGLVQSPLWNQMQNRGLLNQLIEGAPANIKSQGVSGGAPPTGGASFFSGITGGFKDVWAGMSGGKGIGGMFSGIGAGISQGFGQLISGGIAGAISAGIGLLTKGVGALFGKILKSEEKKVNDMRDAAFSAAGGFESLNEKAALAGISLDKVLATKKVKDFEAAMADVNKAIAEQERILEKYDVTWQDFSGEARVREFGKAMKDVVGDYEALTRAGLSHETAALKVKDAYIAFAKEAVKAGEEIPAAMAPVLRQLAEMGRLTEADAEALLGMAGDGLPAIGAMEDAAARYGIKLGDLGDRFASQKLFGAFEQIKADFDLLTQGGAGAGTVLEGMTDEMSKLLQQAIDLGATIPTSMKPILESLIEQGKLVDDSGHAFKDLSGVKFAEPLESAVGRLITKLDELIEKIGTTGDEFGKLPSSLPDPTAGWGKSSDNYQGPETLPAYASGTRGRYLDFGGGTPVLLHGRERVMTEAEGRNTGGGALETIASALDGIDRRISTAVSRAVTDALILAPGWR